MGQWLAIKMAIRRSPQFRFDYFLRSLPIDQIGRRCEYLMRSALKEIEFLEKKYREDAGLLVDEMDAAKLPPIVLPKFQDIQKRVRLEEKEKREKEKKNLEEKVENLEVQMKDIHDRLKQLSREQDGQKENVSQNVSSAEQRSSLEEDTIESSPSTSENAVVAESLDETKGATGPCNDFIEFPKYDGSDPPREPRKAFAQFCRKTREEVKDSLGPEDRKDKEKVNGVLRERFTSLSDEERQVWQAWSSWDKNRYAHDLSIYKITRSQATRKRKADSSLTLVPKKISHSSSANTRCTLIVCPISVRFYDTNESITS